MATSAVTIIDPHSTAPSERSQSRPPRTHEAWSRFVASLSADMAENEIATLTWPTVKELAAQGGFMARPLDAAHIELAWQERHVTIEEQKAQAVLDVRRRDEQRRREEEEAQRRAEAQEAAAAAAAANGSLKRKSSGYGAAGLKRTTSTMSAGAGAGPATPPRQQAASLAAAAGGGGGGGARGIFQSPLHAQAPPEEQQQPGSPTAMEQREGSGSPSRGGFADPNRSPSPDVRGQRHRVDTGKSRTASNGNGSSARNDVICIQDLRAVFDKYAGAGAGSGDEGIDSTRFAKLCKECNLIDKVFTVREADVLFQSCKLSKAERRMPYHQFRMRLIPELAGKKRVTINDIVRVCNYRLSGVEEESRKERVRQQRERLRQMDEEERAREEFEAQERAAAEAERRRKEEERAARSIVPPLRRSGSFERGGSAGSRQLSRKSSARL